MIFTAEDYAEKHGITVSLARERLREMYDNGEATRRRTGKIGGTLAYEILNDLKANDPFNLGATHEKRRGYVGPNMQYKYQRTDS